MKGKIFSKLSALLLLFMMVSGGLFAADASLDLSGLITASTSVSFIPTAVASSLTLTADATGLEVGSLTENSNDPDGYTLTAKSTNGFAVFSETGVLKGNTGGNPDSVTYTMAYGGTVTPFDTTSGLALLKDVTLASPGNVVTAITITYTGSTILTADTYSDTITFTITAK